MHLVLGLPPAMDDRAVAQRLHQTGVSTRPLSLYHLRQRAAGKGLVLGYGAVDEEQVSVHFDHLASTLRPLL